MWAGMDDWASFNGFLEWNLHLPAPASRLLNLCKCSGSSQVTASNVVDMFPSVPLWEQRVEDPRPLIFALMFPRVPYVLVRSRD